MKMLYMQTASEKTALHRDNLKLKEKTEKKRQKNGYLKSQLEEVTKNLQKKLSENAQLGQII